MFFGGNKKIIKTKIIFILLFFVLFFPTTREASAQIVLSNGNESYKQSELRQMTSDQLEKVKDDCTNDDKEYDDTLTNCKITKPLFNLVDGYVKDLDEDEGGFLDRLTNSMNKLNPSVWFGDAVDSLLEGFNSFILEIFGILLRLSGLILNSVIQYTIFGMSTFINDTGAIKVSWEIIRDIINMTFIFGILYISIRTIIFGIGNMKNLLAGLIVAALLVNFSYFFTSVLIDVSNYITVQIYEQLADEDCAGNNIVGRFDSGLSNCFLSKTKIMTLQNPNVDGLTSEITNNGSNGTDAWSTLSATVMGVLFIIILAFVLLALAMMLAIRFIVLIFLLITSPVMFLGLVLPFFKKISSDWLEKLTGNLLFAPLAFLFILITLVVADQVQGSFSGAGLVNNTISFILIIGFAIASLIISKNLGASGASFATAKMGNTIFGGVGAAGRNTIGRWAMKGADKLKGTGAASVAARNVLKSVGGKTFDARNTETFKGVASATGLTKLDLGKAQSKGFAQLREAKEKEFGKTHDELGKTRGDELKQIDTLRDKIKDEFSRELDDIKNAEDETKRLKERQDLLDKEDPEYKNIQGLLLQQKKIIAERRKTIETDTRGGGKMKDKNGNEIAISIFKQIDNIEKAGKARQEAYLKRISGGNGFWGGVLTTSTLASRAKARQIRAEAEKKKGQKDMDKLLDGIKKNSGGDNKDEKKAA